MKFIFVILFSLFTKFSSALGTQQLKGKILSFNESSVKLQISKEEFLLVPRSYFKKNIRENLQATLTLNDVDMKNIKSFKLK